MLDRCRVVGVRCADVTVWRNFRFFLNNHGFSMIIEEKAEVAGLLLWKNKAILNFSTGDRE